MIIDTTGTYRLTQDLRVRNLTTVATVPAGATITITQIDHEGHQVIGPEMLDWMHWDLPCEPERAALDRELAALRKVAEKASALSYACDVTRSELQRMKRELRAALAEAQR